MSANSACLYHSADLPTHIAGSCSTTIHCNHRASNCPFTPPHCDDCSASSAQRQSVFKVESTPPLLLILFSATTRSSELCEVGPVLERPPLGAVTLSSCRPRAWSSNLRHDSRSPEGLSLIDQANIPQLRSSAYLPPTEASSNHWTPSIDISLNPSRLNHIFDHKISAYLTEHTNS